MRCMGLEWDWKNERCTGTTSSVQLAPPGMPSSVKKKQIPQPWAMQHVSVKEVPGDGFGFGRNFKKSFVLFKIVMKKAQVQSKIVGLSHRWWIWEFSCVQSAVTSSCNGHNCPLSVSTGHAECVTCFSLTNTPLCHATAACNVLTIGRRVWRAP